MADSGGVRRPGQSRTSPSAASAERPSVLALVSDLMLSVRLEAAAPPECDLVVGATPAALEAALASRPVDLVLLDLADSTFALEETVGRVRRHAPRPVVLAFFPHVRKDLESRARDAGCDLIMPRSQFLIDLPAALRRGIALSRVAREA